MRPPRPALVTRELEPDLWPALERLFGENGACGGCWCQWWRIEKGERYEDVKGATAKTRMRRLVQQGRAHGVLAFDGQEPVGWCSFERRLDLPRLDRAPSFAIPDAADVWSVPCFFVKAGWRRRGVASLLLRAAEKALAARGARLAEAYPVKHAGRLPMAFNWTGLTPMFDVAGWRLVGPRPKGKQRYRKVLRPAR